MNELDKFHVSIEMHCNHLNYALSEILNLVSQNPLNLKQKSQIIKEMGIAMDKVSLINKHSSVFKVDSKSKK